MSPAAQRIANGRPRILVVEDSPTNLKLAMSILARLEIDADGVPGGLEALAALQKQRYSLIFMDISMPDMDGIEATRAIRMMGFEPGEMPIIALTANALPGDRENYVAAGMNDYLPKPATPAAMREMLGRYIDLSKPVAVDAASAPETPVLATEQLKMLQDQIGPEALEIVLQQFVEELSDRRTKLTSQDIGVIRRESHALKSTAATFGALRLAEAAGAAENAAQLGLMESIAIASRLPTLIEDARAAILDFLNDSAG